MQEPRNLADIIAQMKYIVRRLTPTECERLMGLPDGWTIPSNLVITDELVEEFQRIHDTFGAIMYEYAVASYERSHREGEPPPQPPKRRRRRKSVSGWRRLRTPTLARTRLATRDVATDGRRISRGGLSCVCLQRRGSNGNEQRGTPPSDMARRGLPRRDREARRQSREENQKGVEANIGGVEMSEQHYETVDDILREMRECAIGAATEIVGIADRIEAAHKPIGNAAKMREAMLQIRDSFYIDPDDNKCHSDIDASDLREICDAALSAPPRNCDVGTAEEQEIRFKKFCNSHYNINNVDGECNACPLNENIKTECEFAWAQMPYEEGDNDGSK